MTEVAVREAHASDAEAIARLCTQLGYSSTPDVMPERLSRVQNDPNAHAIVAELDRVVRAFATVHLRYTMNHATPIAQLTLLVVDEGQRGKGVGRAIVERAERWARARGARRFVVTTGLQRADAHAFYERIGFTHTGRRYGKDFE